jgi:hypothetical protein
VIWIADQQDCLLKTFSFNEAYVEDSYVRAFGETHILTIFFAILWQLFINFTLFSMMKTEEII